MRTHRREVLFGLGGLAAAAYTYPIPTVVADIDRFLAVIA